MSITSETAAQHKNDPAVVCCLTTAGTIISPADLEDSGLLKLHADILKIGQVVGAKLLKTIDALTPLNPDLLEGVQGAVEEAHKVKPETDMVTETSDKQPAASSANVVTGGMVRIRIEEAKGIDLEFPTVVLSGSSPKADSEIQAQSVQAAMGAASS